MPSSAVSDRDYFTLLYEQHHRSLYAYAYKKSKDRFIAEEITQTAFIKCWQHLTKTTIPHDAPEKLLFFIAKALLVDFFRKKNTTISISNVLAAVENVPDESIEQINEVLRFDNLVRSAADTLPDRQKQIFEMNYFQELKHEQIATALNISRQTVKNLLAKAKKHVRKLTAQQFLTSFTGLL